MRIPLNPSILRELRIPKSKPVHLRVFGIMAKKSALDDKHRHLAVFRFWMLKSAV